MAEFFLHDYNRNFPRKRKLYRDKVNPTEEYDDNDFYRRFRFTKPIFGEICDMLRPQLERKDNRGGSLTVACQVAAALRYYASGSFQQIIGDTIGMSQQSQSNVITSVSTALDSLIDDHIYFPTDPNELQIIKRGFHALAGFPNVIGAIDGTHIPIGRQKDDDNQFFNRKGFRSLNVQACCDHNGVYTSILVKYPGSSHDSYILKCSNLWDYMEANSNIGYLLGDSGYPLRPWLMTPIKNPQPGGALKYTSAHAKSRVVVENSFGRLKRRFAVLSIPNRRKTLANIAADIRACMILHNIATRNRLPDFFGPDLPEVQGDIIANQNVNATGQLRRLALVNEVFQN